MRVIGTAGHVDHGKSSLVHALTGIDPDRLKEEKERQMTIDLGFAWLTLPSGQSVSLVDVPGHEAFIKNMLAGVGGIDAALLVIAADEGIMPQTREHLAILDLLQVKGGVVALTKIDIRPDREWLELVCADIRKELETSVLSSAEIIPVSSKTRQGLDELINELDRLLQNVSPKNDVLRPRLPIDRVFSMAGFGTVVTGTLIDGTFKIGDEIEIVPGAKRGRIRGLQTHQEKRERALPGTRVAINLSGLGVDELERGQVVALPGTIAATTRIDTRLQYLASAPKPLEHNASVDFFSGSAQIPAHVHLLDARELAPGASGWVQFDLAEPAALAKNDRFIIRFPSPSATIGGGIIVDAHAKRHRRFRADVLARLETLARGSPDELVLEFLTMRGTKPPDKTEIEAATHLPRETVTKILNAQIESGAVVSLDTHFASSAGWRALKKRIGDALDEFHRTYPLRAGLPREELKSKLGLTPRVFDKVIERAQDEKTLTATADLVRRPDFMVTFGSAQQEKVDALLTQFARSPYAPPSAQQVEQAIGSEALGALVAQGTLVRLNQSVLLSSKSLSTMRDWVVQTLRTRGEVTAADVRDAFDTSRKYAIALLEYLDETRVTKRVGDARVLR